nr:type 1 glutamine amidotransferase domain-containing protein [Rhodothermus marinus]
MGRVLFVVTNHSELGSTGQKTGYYLSEVAHPFHVLHEAGYEIDFVSPKGGKAPMDEELQAGRPDQQGLLGNTRQAAG